MKTQLHLGLDVHQDAIAVAVAEEGSQGEVRERCAAPAWRALLARAFSG